MQNKYLTDKKLTDFIESFDAASAFAAALFSPEETITFYGGNSSSNKKTITNEKTLFDTASLTKALFTAPTVLNGLYSGLFSDDMSFLKPYVSEQTEKFFRNISIFNLLNHTSGLKSYEEFFKNASSADEIYRLIVSEPPVYPRGTDFLYSDLGYMLLGLLLQKKIKNPHLFFLDKLSDFFNVKDKLLFDPDPKLHVIADNLELKPADGLPHDEHARIIGPDAGHAGLFATAEGVVLLVKHYLDVFKGRLPPDAFPGRLACEKMFSIPQENTEFSYGWNTPSPQGYTSAGTFPVKGTYGHLGFTGCSVWFHVESECGAVFLSNRTHGGRYEKLSEIKTFRTRFYALVADFFRQKGFLL